MIPFYYNKTNVVFSPFYNIGIMSFEIIMRKDTFIESDWIKEPLLDFKFGNKCLEIASQEKFEENACQKRFLFININTYKCFPNLNLGKYSIFKYNFTTDAPSHFKVYLNEDFEHIGFFRFKIGSLKEKTVDFDKLNKLYEKCQKFKEYIDEIKTLYKKGNYLFEIKVYTKMTLNLEVLNDISPDEIDNLNLFLRQNIKILEEKGKELIFYFSNVNLFLFFINKDLGKYFVHIMILFETFQNYLTNIYLDEFDKLKLIFSVSEILKGYLTDDYVGNILDYNIEELVKLNLIRIVDFKDDNIYSFVENNNYEIINNLNNNSYLFYILNQLNSSLGKNMIRENYISSQNSNCSMISMVTLEDLKKEFGSFKQKYGLKIGFKTKYNAISNIITKITCYNEINLYGKYLEKEIIEDPNYIYKMKLSITMKHERFFHILFSINIFTGNLDGSPEEYLYFEEKSEIMLVIEGQKESENGFEYLISKNFDFLNFIDSSPKNINFEQFFDFKIWIDNTMLVLYYLYNNYIKGKNSLSKENPNGKNDVKDDINENKTLKICRDNYCDIFKEEKRLKKCPKYMF